MSTRKERKNRWWLRCPRCGAWKVKHCTPFKDDHGKFIWLCS